MTIIATVGASNANSYVTESEANLYFENRLHGYDTWDEFDDKDKALITASQLLDWYVSWKGTKTDESQSMQWPREDVIRQSGVEIDDDVIPPEVKKAVYELAYVSLSSDRTADDALAGIEQVKVSSLMIKADNGDVESTKRKVIPEQVWKILSDLTVPSSASVVWLLRA
jgi:hypothetical protein